MAFIIGFGRLVSRWGATVDFSMEWPKDFFQVVNSGEFHFTNSILGEKYFYTKLLIRKCEISKYRGKVPLTPLPIAMAFICPIKSNMTIPASQSESLHVVRCLKQMHSHTHLRIYLFTVISFTLDWPCFPSSHTKRGRSEFIMFLCFFQRTNCLKLSHYASN